MLSRPIDLGWHLRIKDKVLNFWGIAHVVVILSVAAALLPFMAVFALLCDYRGNGKVSN
jgi:hypothetical protein